MDLKIDISRCGIKEEEIKKYSSEVDGILGELWSGKADMTGWVQLPLNTDKAALERLLNYAAIIQTQCEEMIVIGVGGSYLGARAVLHGLVGFDQICGTEMPSEAYPKIKFAGNNLSSTYLSELISDVEKKSVTLCVISKSGTTLETSIAFTLLKEAMIGKYEEKAAERIYVITDKEKGTLREEVEREGYASFEVPEDIGGRFSVLSPVGLLPIAVGGINVEELLAGAAAMATSTAWDFDGWYYSAVRYALMNKGKQIEIFEYYEPQLEFFAEWLKQLFGESEGKEGKGMFPVALQCSADLHSLGQFLQEGNQIFYETVLNVVKPDKDIFLPRSAGQSLEGLNMDALNKAAMEGVMAAHEAINIPIVKIDIPEMNAFYMGQLIYFFETTCAITAKLMGVNPFDQPGVEAYKREMNKKIKDIG